MPFSPASRLSLVAWLIVLPSCGDFFEKLGNSDQGYFEITPRTSLARGGWLTFTVRDYEAGNDGPSNISFQLVSESNNSVARIQSVGKTEATLVVEGLAAGSSHVDFRAVADGNSKDDGFTLTVAEVTRLGFDPCHANGKYVRGTDGAVSYSFNPGSYPTVNGLGFYPITMAPAGAVTLRTDASTDARWIFSIPATAPAQVVLASSLPNDQARFTMNIVDRSAIDGVFSTVSSASAETRADLTILPSAGGVPVCVYAKRKITSTTPTVCKLVADITTATDVVSLTTYDDSVSVRLIAAGACKLALEIADLAFTGAMPELTVTPHTSSGGGGHDWD